MNPDKQLVIKIARVMFLARTLEERLLELFAAGKVAGWIHSGVGQEATGAVLGSVLKESDYLVPYHRSRSSLLGKGLDVKTLIAEILGRTTGCCKGKGGEAHIGVPHLGILGTGGIIGSNIPIALGIAYAIKLKKSDQVVACGFGEGGSNRGAFHESLNMASLWSLPVVFICENNRYAEFTPVERQMKIQDVAQRAAGYGIPGVVVDGNDVDSVYPELEKALKRARSGEGPTLIESKTYRIRGHYEGDPLRYRPKEELEEWKNRDPVIIMRSKLVEKQYLTGEEIEALEKDIEKEVEEAIDYALNSPFPAKEDILADVYAD